MGFPRQLVASGGNGFGLFERFPRLLHLRPVATGCARWAPHMLHPLGGIADGQRGSGDACRSLTSFSVESGSCVGSPSQEDVSDQRISAGHWCECSDWRYLVASGGGAHASDASMIASSKSATRTATIGPPGGLSSPKRRMSALLNGRTQAKPFPPTNHVRVPWRSPSVTSGSGQRYPGDVFDGHHSEEH